MTAFLNSEQIVKYKEDITSVYSDQSKLDSKITTAYVNKASAIERYDSIIASNTTLSNDNKVLLIKMITNYFLHTGVALSTDYPAILPYLGLEQEGDFIVIGNTTYYFATLGRVNS